MLNKYLDGIKSSELKSLGLMLGAVQTGTKKDLKEGLNEQMIKLDTLRNLRDSKSGLKVMGIDLGIANFALTTFHWNKDMERPMLKEMYKVQLAGDFVDLKEGELTPPLRPEVMATLGLNLGNWLTQFGSNAYFIERQRSRSASSSTILENILKVMILEYVLYSNLQNKIVDGSLPAHLFPSLPKRMVAFTCSGIPIDKLTGSHGTPKRGKSKSKSEQNPTSNMLSKKIRIALCRSLIFDQISGKQRQFYKFDLDPSFVKTLKDYPGDKSLINFHTISKGSGLDLDFRQRNKNDDLCDSLLHGFVWLQWLANYCTLLNFVDKNMDCTATGQENFQELIRDFAASHDSFMSKVITII